MDLTTRLLKIKLGFLDSKDYKQLASEFESKMPGYFDKRDTANYTITIGHEGTDLADNKCTVIIKVKD
jgi:hypothetical protein